MRRFQNLPGFRGRWTLFVENLGAAQCPPPNFLHSLDLDLVKTLQPFLKRKNLSISSWATHSQQRFKQYDWMSTNLLVLNPLKTEFLSICTPQRAKLNDSSVYTRYVGHVFHLLLRLRIWVLSLTNV